MVLHSLRGNVSPAFAMRAGNCKSQRCPPPDGRVDVEGARLVSYAPGDCCQGNMGHETGPSCDDLACAHRRCRSPQVHYVDCGEPYVKEGKVVADLMPDFLHPNGPGARASLTR